MIQLLSMAVLLPTALPQAPQPSDGGLPKIIPVVVVQYYPLDGDKIDIKVTSNVGAPYTEIKAKCEALTQELAEKLEEGTRFRGYKNPNAKPSLRYKILRSYEFKTTIPARGGSSKMPDYNAVMKAIDAKTWVEQRGVKEFWIWAYHSPNSGLWESNMSSPFGDTSNSDRDNKDLPVFSKTYTVYHYNYERGIGEALENHLHQFEHLWNHIDGRDTAKPEDWPELLFWGKFVGSDISHKLVTTPIRCGWTHYAPNSESDYDWRNERYVETDIEDWHPDKSGKTQRMNASRWDYDHVKWKVYWLQAIPGANHGLTYKGKPLRNWWMFVYDWDTAKKQSWKLTY